LGADERRGRLRIGWRGQCDHSGGKKCRSHLDAFPSGCPAKHPRRR
jgi:hypothetical protein